MMDLQTLDFGIKKWSNDQNIKKFTPKEVLNHVKLSKNNNL